MSGVPVFPKCRKLERVLHEVTLLEDQDSGAHRLETEDGGSGLEVDEINPFGVEDLSDLLLQVTQAAIAGQNGQVNVRRFFMVGKLPKT